MLLLHTPTGVAQTLEQQESRAPFGGTYRKALAHNPTTLDPAFVSAIHSSTVVRQIYNGLGQFDAHLKPLPAIAAFWEASRDGLVWTFTLCRGGKCHHGREVTANAAVVPQEEVERLGDPCAHAPVGTGPFKSGHREPNKKIVGRPYPVSG